MRDKKRIREFCSRLADAWEQYPDLRFWQFITVFGTKDNDQYYMEEEDLIAFIETNVKNTKRYSRKEE